MDQPQNESGLKSTKRTLPRLLVVFRAKTKPVPPVVWIPAKPILVSCPYPNQPTCITTTTIYPFMKIGPHPNKYPLKSSPESYPRDTNLYLHPMRYHQL